jgi:hypothetical protein
MNCATAGRATTLPTDDEAVRWQTCESLEAEFKAIHGDGSLGDAIPAKGDVGARETALRQKCHALEDGQSALCLSGGGIRSATYCLGVMQGLAAARLLGTIHYLSTVSGGGYIGSWLTAWQRRAGVLPVLEALAASSGKSPTSFVDAPPRSAGVEPEPIRRLRAYSNYLSPAVGLGGDLFALIGTFLRNLFLHWLAIVPLLVAILLVPRLYVGLLWLEGPPWDPPTLMFIAIVLVTYALAHVVAGLPNESAGATNATQLEQDNRFVLSCLLPLAVAAVMLSWLGAQAANPLMALRIDQWLGGSLDARKTALWGGIAGMFSFWIGVTVGAALRGSPRPKNQNTILCSLWATVIGFAGGATLGWALNEMTVHGAQTWPAPTFDRKWLDWYSVYSAPAIFALLWTCTTVYAGIVSKWRGEDGREWWARAGGYWIVAALAWVALCIIVIHLPRWVLSIPALQQAPGSATVGAAALLGLASSLWGYWGKYRTALRDGARTIADRLGTRVLDLLALGFVLLLCLALDLGISGLLHGADRDWLEPKVDEVVQIEDEPFQNEMRCAAGCSPCIPDGCKSTAPQLPAARKLSVAYGVIVHEARLCWLLSAFVALCAIGWLMWSRIGGNTFSLHSMYCNRLVRAYLGASTVRRRPHWFTGFDPADNVPLAVEEEPKEWRLFPVIGATLNLVKAAGDRLEWQQRKAAAFTLTPLCSGSPRLGYRDTATYDVTSESAVPSTGITLGRAMAVSGAAASPNMGYHSSTLVALVMFFFNVRLGWWLRNPALDDADVSRKELGSLGLLAAEALGRTSEGESFVYLSDGGHFENLGLYEMVRRRCRRIVVVDAAHDPNYAYEDLANCVRKVRVDFGIPIEFNDGLPTVASCRRTRLPFALGRIRYGTADGQGAKDGTIVYLKPALCGDEPTDVADYAQRSRRGSTAFPQQPTSDQFFDEAQFESYRILGLQTAWKAFKGGWPAVGPNHGPIGGLPEAGPTGSDVAALPTAAAGAGNAAGRGLANGGNAFNSLGNAAKLGLVAAGTAAIAVTGTVTLSGGELKLSQESVQALSNVRGTLGISESDRKVLVEKIKDLQDAIDRLATGIAAQPPESASSRARPAVGVASQNLTAAIGNLSDRIASAPVSEPLPDDVRKQIIALDVKVQALQRAIELGILPGPLADALRAAAKELSSAATALKAAADKLPPPSPPGSAPKVIFKLEDPELKVLTDINRTLGEIKSTIDNVPPRRNVRSTTEGGRP